jgi:elongation factor G
VASLQIPIGKEANFKGEVNTVNRKAFLGHESGDSPVPDDLRARMDEERAKLVEVAAEADDKLIEKFLGGEELSDDEVRAGLKSGLQAGTLFPVLCGSATQNIGIPYIFKFLADYAPSPLDAPEANAKNPATKQDESLGRVTRVLGICLQDHSRPLRRQTHLLSHLFGSHGIGFAR